MSRRRLAILGCASIAALSGALAPTSPVLAASPGLSLVHDIPIYAPIVCNRGIEWAQYFSSPAVGDLFGDGRKEIVAGLPDGNVHVWYADTFTEVPGWPRNTGDNVASSPTLAVLDGDTLPSIIIGSYLGTVNVWDRFGNERAGWPQWSLYGNIGAGIQPGFFSSVAVGDAFGDRRMELFATALDQHTYAWFSNGTPLPGWPKLMSDSGLATPALADLQHDRTLSIVTPTDASGRLGVKGGLYFAWAANGRQLWVRGYDEVPWSSPAITDFGDGNYVTVNGTGHNYHQLRDPANGKYLVGMNQDGSNRAGFPVPTNDVSFASPAVGDLLGNGGREVVEITEAGNLYAQDGNGNAIQGFPRSLPGGHIFPAGAVIAPVDATGRNGIYAPQAFSLAVYSMASLGAPTIVATPGNANPMSTPTVANLGNGHLSVVLGSVAGNTGCGQWVNFHITVWSVAGTDPHSITPASWPTFHGNMQRTGSNIPPIRCPAMPLGRSAHTWNPNFWEGTIQPVCPAGASGGTVGFEGGGGPSPNTPPSGPPPAAVRPGVVLPARIEGAPGRLRSF